MNPPPILLIDARNCLYRSIYIGKKEALRKRRSVHYFTIMLRLMASWVRQYKPAMVQVFWDAPRNTVWRKQILEGYKKRDDNGWLANISDELVQTETIARAIFPWMNVYQFGKKAMEADDLIYAACRLQMNRPMVVCSTDSDMCQISYAMDCVRIYHPEDKRELPRPTLSPVLLKVLEGDKADKIPGYQGVGPVTAAKLAASTSLLQEHLSAAGRDTFSRNLLLIDLGFCPYLLQNTLYVGRTLATPPQFDRAKIIELDKQHRVAGLVDEFVDVVAPFMHLPNY